MDISGQSTERYQDSEIVTDDVSLWSGEVEAAEGLEMSQQMMDSLLLGAGTQLKNEEYLTGISSRLQTALEKMLMAITDTTNQVWTQYVWFNCLGSVHSLLLVVHSRSQL